MDPKLFLTFDVEDWYHIPSVTGSPFSIYEDSTVFFQKWKQRYDYLSKPTIRLLDLLDKQNISSTFFVVADIISSYPGLVEEIHSRGHEIACHGLDHSCKIHPKTNEPLLSLSDFSLRTSLAKSMLEDITGEPVFGYRAPSGYYSENMISELPKLGFKYDSSIMYNSILKKSRISNSVPSSNPYFLSHDDSFMEFPLSYWKIGSFYFPTSGGPWLRFLGSNLMIRGITQTLRTGDAVFYLHPLDLSVEKFPSIGNNRPFYWAIKGKLIEKRLLHIIETMNKNEVEISTIRKYLSSYV
ncbi:MAG: polysaccharide deacetylase family protein [Candidatus Bathyarchaeota archaeon]|nr:polysaccharide deacetylase family protein [Candidatus Bathyarchaeota archaeon]